jgi:DNA mismatch repair protein MSH6
LTTYRWSWLVDIKDDMMRKPDESDYNPKKLYIPKSLLVNLTEFNQQYWSIKKENFDCVIFMKKGKFYELYENDAGNILNN